MKQMPLKAAIIGCGKVAGWYDEGSLSDEVYTHAKAYGVHPRTELIAVFDESTELAERFARVFGGRAYTDVDEMLERTRPDIISICAPDEAHLPMLFKCLEAGPKAVWCEKPLCCPGDRPDALVEEYGRRGVGLAVNYVRRWDPEIARIKEALRSGEIGTPRRVVAHYSKGLAHCGSHFLDLFLDWFGKPLAFEVLDRHVDFKNEDPTVDVKITFSQGMKAYLLGGDERDYSLDEIDLYASGGRVKVIDYSREVEWYYGEKHPQFGVMCLPRNPLVRKTAMDRVMLHVLEGIVRSIDGKGLIASDGPSSLQTFRLCSDIIERAGTTSR